jgi:amino acid transporter
VNKKSKLPQTLTEKVWHGVLGEPRDPHDPALTHKLSLIAFLAWVGLGVDGLTSSAYGPDESFRALGQYHYLAIFLALATAFTVVTISYTYSRLIEHFPHGGGGYLVATQILGKQAGVVSGCALLVDYVLTIAASIAGGGDALFSLLPFSYHAYKLPVELAAVLFLIVMNLRGLKESVKAIVPVFIVFMVAHTILILGGIFFHAEAIPALVDSTRENLSAGVSQIGKWGLFLIFLRAYSMGGGTYTGIEAVSNGVGALREPRVATGKRAMLYLSTSLAFMAGGLILCYMLFGVRPVEGQTLNAVLVKAFAGNWRIGELPVGIWFVTITLFSESLLLLVAAQTGFIDGPRVMANMALDSWLPKKFASLSDRLTMQNGIRMMGAAALVTLFVTKGSIGLLLIMYSINVFITFSMSQVAMIRFWWTSRREQRSWKRNTVIHAVGFVLCFSILWVMIIEKFLNGAWVTILITALGVGICFSIRNHYRKVAARLKNIEGRIEEVNNANIRKMPHVDEKTVPKPDPSKPTAVILVGGSNRLGIRSVLAALRSFPNTFQNIVFISVGVITSEFFKTGDLDSLKERTEKSLQEYVSVVRKMGYPSAFWYRLGTDIVWEASELCVEVAREFPHATFFAGEIVFRKPHWFDKILHNETSLAIQRHIRFAGLPMVILPLVLEE